MKVLVVNNAIPFVWGGAEELALNLTRRLNLLDGVEAELLRIPFSWQPSERLVLEMALNRRLDIHNTDRVIALKFPAYLVNHPSKTLWLLHQFRQAYDLLEAGQSFLDSTDDAQIINAIKAADNACFDKARHLFVNSPVTRDRLQRFNARQGEVLYPPLNDEDLFTPGPYGDYVFAGGRVTSGKRQHLLIEAMAHAGPDARLVIAGPCDSEDYAADLAARRERLGLGDRVHLQLRLHSREEIAALASNALAAIYIPYDEDSLGYVTMEAFAAARCVVTTSDSGGLLEIVREGETGAVTDPDAPSLGAALASLFSDRARTERMGRAAADLWSSRNITWAHTLEKLLA